MAGVIAATSSKRPQRQQHRQYARRSDTSIGNRRGRQANDNDGPIRDLAHEADDASIAADAIVIKPQSYPYPAGWPSGWTYTPDDKARRRVQLTKRAYHCHVLPLHDAWYDRDPLQYTSEYRGDRAIPGITQGNQVDDWDDHKEVAKATGMSQQLIDKLDKYERDVLKLTDPDPIVPPSHDPFGMNHFSLDIYRGFDECMLTYGYIMGMYR
jgi:hypothetical protein